MGSLGEVDHGKEKFHGHGHSDPIVDELNRLENLLRGLFFFPMHACMHMLVVGLITVPVILVMLHFASTIPQ